MYLKNGYSDALILSEGRCKKYTNNDRIVVPAMYRSELIRTKGKETVRRVGEPKLVNWGEVLN